ncbi:MAG: glycosyltransferase family 2 protein [Actinomycetota bacterium]
MTPVYNGAESIESCLNSVAAQTYGAIEHIIVDGGSTDGTLSIVKSFAARYPLTWISEPDKGMYDAINKGMTRASGTFVGYLNCDDQYLPWTVETAATALAAGYDLVYGDLASIDLRGDRPALYPHFYPPFSARYYTYSATLGQPTVFWTNDLAERIGPFDTSFRLVGDHEYWLRAAAAGASLIHIDEILALQLEHGGTLRERFPRELQEELARVRRRYATFGGPPPSSLVQGARRRLRWRWYQSQFIAAGMWKKPRKWPRFMRFLDQNCIRVDPRGLLWYLLPGPIRPRTASLLDADRFRDAVARASRS